MTRIQDDRIQQVDEIVSQQLDENIRNVLPDLQPVEAVILPDERVAIVNNNLDLVPIGGQDTAGTVNAESSLLIVCNSNETEASILVNGENTFRTAPTKLSYTFTDVIKNGEILITSVIRERNAKQSYRITVVQNPNFSDITFDEYRTVPTNIDGVLNIEPDRQRRIFTNTLPYGFKIEYFEDGNLLNSEVIFDVLNSKNFEFNYDRNVRIPDVPVDIIGIQAPTFNLVINVTGPSQAINIQRLDQDERLTLNTGNTPLVVDAGSQFSVSPVNTTLFRIVDIQYIPETQRIGELPFIQGIVNFEFTVESNAVLNIIVEEITGIDISIPTLSLVSSDDLLIYNINSNANLPLVVRSNIPIQNIIAYINDKTYNFTLTNSDVDNMVIIPSEAFTEIGIYKLILIPVNSEIQGNQLELAIKVINEIYVGVPDITNIIYPKEIVGPDYAGTNVDFEISYESIDTDFVKIYINNSTGFFKEKARGVVKLNFQKLLEYINYDTSANENQINLFLKLVPHNISGIEEVVGREEIISISFLKSDLEIPRSMAINRIAEAFLNQLDENIFQEETSKFLTHLIHFPAGNNKVVTTWLGDRGTIIFKLYEPLETSIQPNQELWVSKLISTPIIETVTLIGEEDVICNTLKGPNFSLLPDNGIEFKIFEELTAAGSLSSNTLITNYANKKGIDTDNVVIEYVSGSEYVFENFVNFSSATERVNNFFYKVQLLEIYEKRVSELSEINLSESNEKIRINNLITETKSNFDGFEKFLYYSTPLNSNNLAFPKTNPSSSVLLNTTSSLVTLWYDNIISDSHNFDKLNPNKLSNNIPEYIIERGENKDFVLFMDMIGQHFDTIWVYIKSLSNKKLLFENPNIGISNDLVIHMLESFGWDSKRAFDSQFLWEYAFGQYQDGRQKYSKSLKSANEEIWRRILNNLPYILKHKGTARAMKAVMACYGVPQSMLTIMEYGGPQDPTKGGTTQFTFDDRTAAYFLSGSSSIKIPWTSSSLADYPNCIEVRIKPNKLPNTTYTIISGSEWTLDLVRTTGSFGKLELNFGGNDAPSPYILEPFVSASISTFYFDPIDPLYPYVFGPDLKTGSLDFPISTEHYSNIAINRYNFPDSSSMYQVWFGTTDGQRLLTSVSMSIVYNDNQWDSGSYIQIGGNGFEGALDEFRLWKVPLERSKFNNHTLFPDAINGNSISASTEDLLFRLDFEYPKDRTIDPYIKNVAINQIYGHASATASFTYNAPNYPYQYIPYDRTVTATVPSLGFAYSNKIRFESASLVTDLSYKARATQKAFDRAPIDSNRLGLFFSPIKEVNMDILKTFGDFNIDNYIGDPADEYKDDYRELSILRGYYFERMERDVYEYIQLVKYIDKSLFDVLENLAPARAKVSKGLLIEPHFLERSKTRWSKPVSERKDFNSVIKIDELNDLELSYEVKQAHFNNETLATFEGETPSFQTHIDSEDFYFLQGTNPNYDGLIEYKSDEFIQATTPFYSVDIQGFNTGSNIVGEIDSFNFTQIGMDKNSLENIGFGLYAENGVSILRNYDGLFGNFETTGSRKSVFLVKEERNKKISTQVSGWPTSGSQPGDQVRFEDIAVPFNTFKISILPFGSTIAIGNEVIEVTPINGYLPTHYKFKFLPEGLQRSYFKGSVQTSLTTPDGLPAVETFTTNPNILRVAKTGRGSGEPILEVD